MRNLFRSLALVLVFMGCPFVLVAQNTSVGDGKGTPRSQDLEADIKVMWSVAGPKPDRNWVTATPEAVNAAERVFNTVNLIGVSEEKLKELLKLNLRSSDYGYYAPFWPVPKGTFPIRIDTGMYGWQFDIYFDQDRKISKIERRGIE